MTGHARNGPSSAERWMNCPGSIHQIEQAPEPPESPFAAEGTAAHKLAEVCLKKGNDADAYIGIEFNGYKATEEMCDAVQVYLDVVRELDPKPEVEVLCKLGEDLWGTADAVAVNGTRLTVVDYKHGKGVGVPITTPQLKVYALGAYLEKRKQGFLIEDVEVVIVQPRLPMAGDEPPGVRRQVLSLEYLADFYQELITAYEATFPEDAKLCAGRWCRWCPAAGRCPANRDRALAGFKVEGETMPPVERLTNEQLGEILHRLPEFRAWAKAVEDHAYDALNNGEVIPGQKLVAKRGRRKWTDEAEVEGMLDLYGVGDQERYRMELKTPAQIDKLLTAQQKREMKDLQVTVSSGTTMAAESDPRPALLPHQKAVEGFEKD